MKFRHTKRYLEVTGQAQAVFETRECDSPMVARGEYICTTQIATYLCRPPGYPGCNFHHIHASNVEPCDPEPSQGHEPREAEAKLCVAEPTDASTSRSALSETKETT